MKREQNFVFLSLTLQVESSVKIVSPNEREQSVPFLKCHPMRGERRILCFIKWVVARVIHFIIQTELIITTMISCEQRFYTYGRTNQMDYCKLKKLFQWCLNSIAINWILVLNRQLLSLQIWIAAHNWIILSFCLCHNESFPMLPLPTYPYWRLTSRIPRTGHNSWALPTRWVRHQKFYCFWLTVLAHLVLYFEKFPQFLFVIFFLFSLSNRQEQEWVSDKHWILANQTNASLPIIIVSFTHVDTVWANLLNAVEMRLLARSFGLLRLEQLSITFRK